MAFTGPLRRSEPNNYDDPYQQWKAQNPQLQQPVEPMELMQVENQFSTANPETMDLVKPINQFSVGNAATPSADWGTMAGAGIQAAGQAAGAIAGAAGRKAANDAWVGGNALNRASSERMAMAQLLQNQQQFDDSRKMNAYNAMLSAITNASNSTSAQRALKRSITNNNVNALQTAFLG